MNFFFAFTIFLTAQRWKNTHSISFLDISFLKQTKVNNFPKVCLSKRNILLALPLFLMTYHLGETWCSRKMGCYYTHNNIPLSVPGKGILIPISLGNSNCFGFMANAAFTNTSIGFAASEEFSSFLGHFSFPDNSADSLFPRSRPLHIGTGTKSAHRNLNYTVYTTKQRKKKTIQHIQSHQHVQ